MHQQTGALDMAQELRSEPSSGVRSFDQPRDIRNHKADLVSGIADRDYSKIWLQRGEWLIGNLGTS